MPLESLSGLTRKALAGWIAMSLCVTSLAADDSPRKHLDGLRAEQKYDAAIEYLERLQKSADTPEDFKQVILYEMGSTLVDASRREREPARRRSLLDKATANFREFIEKHTDHALILTAQNQLANALVETARDSVEQSKRLDEPAKQTHLQDARGQYSEASAMFQVNQAELRKRLEDIPKILDRKDPEQRKLIELRQRYRADFLQASLLIPAVAEEHAETYPADSKEHDELLRAAAEEYEEIHRRYRSLLAGLYARMYQGRCYVKLRQCDQALEVFDELLAQPKSPEAFRMLRQRVVALATDCWLDDDHKDYQRAITELGGVLDNLKPTETKTPNGLELRIDLARAHQRNAEQVAKDTPDDPRIAESRQQAVKHATFVASHDSSHREAAEELLVELGAEQPPAPVEIAELKTFAELNARGRQSMDRWQKASFEKIKLTSKLRSESVGDVRDELQRQLDVASNAAKSAHDLSLAAFQRALELADDAPVEDVLLARYYTCYLLYTQGSFREAAEIGEKLAREHSDSGSAPQTAQIAFGSYLQLYNKSATDEERAAAAKQLREFGEFILKHWADRPVGEDVRKSFERLE